MNNRAVWIGVWAWALGCKPPATVNEPPRLDIRSPTTEADLDEGEPLAVVVYADDGDHDAPITITLAVNGAPAGEATLDTDSGEVSVEVASLPPGNLELTATADDGVSEPRSLSRSFFVNGKPSAPVLRVTPEAPSDDSELVGELAEPGVDPDGKAVTYNWRWHRGGETALAGTTFPAVLPAALTGKGDTWTLEVVVTEDALPGASDPPLFNTASVEVEISNDPPGPPTVSLSPASPTPLHALRCAAAGSVDPQGDAVSYRYAWYRDRGQGWDLQAAHTGETLPASATRGDESWRCAVTATDGGADSEEVTADVRVLASPMEATDAGAVISGAAGRTGGAQVDVDGDGAVDVVLAGYPDAGVVRLWPTAALAGGALDEAAPAATITGPAGFGATVALVDDASGDGLPDVVVTDAGDGVHRSLWLIPSSALPPAGDVAPDSVGLRVDGGVDLGIAVAAANAFGAAGPELFVSDATADGQSAVRAFASARLTFPAQTLAEAALSTMVSTTGRNGLGRALATGELNGGAVGSLDDVLIGVPRAAVVGDNTCAVGITGAAFAAGDEMYAGDAFLQILADEGDACGAAVWMLPDLNGDGSDEMVIGIPGWDGDRGRVVILPGGYFLQTTLDLRRGAHAVELSGPQGAARFGAGLTSPGDVDGDGLAELAVVAPDARGGDGRVYFFEGRQLADGIGRAVAGTPEIIADFEASFIVEGAEGGSVSAPGRDADVDGDGEVDLLLLDGYGTLSVILTTR